MSRREVVGVGLLATVAAITAAWWALALWPLPNEAPAWLARTRWVCFGAMPQGPPSGAGWIALIGEPIAMTALLFVVWGDAVQSGLRALWHSSGGRLTLGLAIGLALAGIGAAGNRVLRAAGSVDGMPQPSLEHITVEDRAAPPLALVDQAGRTFTLAAVRGRPVLLTFAYGHCETVCPLVVRDVREAAAALPQEEIAVAVVTLDPWRDLPARLSSIARAWDLAGDARVLGGSVAEVLAAAEAWGVTIDSDPRTGDITHTPVVFVVDRDGRLAFSAPGGVGVLVQLLQQVGEDVVPRPVAP